MAGLAKRYRFRRNCGANEMAGRMADCTGDPSFDSDPTRTGLFELFRYNEYMEATVDTLIKSINTIRVSRIH